MKKMDLIRGISMGLAAGTAIGFALAPKRKRAKNATSRVLQTVSHVVDNLADAIK